jgi:excisionase family DNA binding protein
MTTENKIVVISLTELEKLGKQWIAEVLAAVQPAQAQGEDILTREEAAELLDVSLATLRTLELNGKIQGLRYPGNRRVYFRRADLLSGLTDAHQAFDVLTNKRKEVNHRK